MKFYQRKALSKIESESIIDKCFGKKDPTLYIAHQLAMLAIPCSNSTSSNQERIISLVVDFSYSHQKAITFRMNKEFVHGDCDLPTFVKLVEDTFRRNCVTFSDRIDTEVFEEGGSKKKGTFLRTSSLLNHQVFKSKMKVIMDDIGFPDRKSDTLVHRMKSKLLCMGFRIAPTKPKKLAGNAAAGDGSRIINRKRHSCCWNARHVELRVTAPLIVRQRHGKVGTR